MADEYKYTCTDCSKSFTNNEIRYLCDSCEKTNTPDQAPKGVLKVEYPYNSIKKKVEKDSNYLSKSSYFDLLPLQSLESMPPLQVGETPLYSYQKKLANGQFFTMGLKVESGNPTFSFKDRASALVSAFAKEKGIDYIIAASTGNAGSSLAGICASQNQKAIILVPEKAPKAKLTQVLMYGAQLIPVKGNYDDAFDLSIRLTKENGWYNRNTAFNPLTIEGKKTVVFELFEQMKGVPDKVFVPVGDGVILSAVYKGFEDLFKLGMIPKIPQIFAVQAKGSANLIDNLLMKTPVFTSSHTLADSIAVDIPRNFNMARKYMLENNGKGVWVSDKDILEASKELASSYGLFVEPAAAAAYAGLLQQLNKQTIGANEKVSVLLTGNGLKDIESVSALLEFPESVNPFTYHTE